ncbi:MAG: DUF4835 family protein [Bacteroidaceae bacterium]|nr:DUF4835 family protein [Bacteroidaceae bacterium]MBR1789433.1 DUF4835 family protein [Bacteroidaceae bacterium]
MRRIVLITIAAAVLAGGTSQAQELRAKVVVNTAQLSNTKTEVFDALKEKAETFLNDHRWSDLQFRESEKIECNFNITVNSWEESTGLIKGTLLMTSSRPVFNSSYNTTLYSVKDGDFQFNFQATDQLEWNPEYVDNNLTAILAYYAYMIIGYDMDSMAPLGGTTYLQTAENIVTNAQSLGFPGWASFSDNKNRFGLLNDYLDGSMEDYRQLIYKYHREGLDQMADNAETARAAITEALGLLEASKDARTMSQLPVLFTEYKRDELVNIYSGRGTSQEKETAYKILFGINTSLSEYWDKLKK